MAFLPLEQPSRPQCVAMHVRSQDPTVYPRVRQDDIKRQEQEWFSQQPSKINTAILNKYDDGLRVKPHFFGGQLPVRRDNGNLINPEPIAPKPWEPRTYYTKESLTDPRTFSIADQRKQRAADAMTNNKQYHEFFTKQRESHSTKAMLELPHPHVSGQDVLGFKGLGKYSPEPAKGRSTMAMDEQQKIPPWLRDDGSSARMPRRQPNHPGLAENVKQLMGPASHYGYNTEAEYHQALAAQAHHPSTLEQKGAFYPKEPSHKRSYHVPGSVGGCVSPDGAKLASRSDTTHAASFDSPQRREALAVGRAHTSMLP